jgi:PAS domain S-box-containing protein
MAQPDHRELIGVEPAADDPLAAGEARLRLALAAADLGIWDWDVASGRMVYSARAKEICGFAPDEEVTIDLVRSVTHPEDLPVTWAQRERAFDPETRDRSPYEYRLLRRDSSVRWVRAYGEVIYEEVDGQLTAVRYTGTLQDITEERAQQTARLEAEERLRELNSTLEARVAERTAELMAAERARREADALYRAYFENTADPLFVIGVDPDGAFRIEQINPAHQAVYGFSADEVRGRRFSDIMPPELAEQVVSHYRRCVESGDVLHYRDTFILDGSPCHADTVLVPLRDASGRITRLVGSSRDVTRQVQAEERLRQAQKMEAVGQLTGGIAHDFNNVLGAMMSGFELIRRKAEDPNSVRRLAEAGLETAERGARLTSQLLTFSRAQRLELKPLRVGELVDGLRDLLERTLGPMVRLVLEIEPTERVVMSDKTQLEMAVLNLAINARDAMPDGGQLTIASRVANLDPDSELPAGAYAELAVTDTGTGMPPEVAARALDPFFTTKGVGKGTGLGLSQVYGMARQGGGTVRLESRPGAGTTVRILLPLADDAVEPQEAERPDPTGAGASGALILLVDDDPDVRGLLAESLTALGYRVVEAASGEAALAAIRRERPDLALLDFAMPEMNGADVAKALRAVVPDLRLLFASGYAETDAIAGVAGKGMRLLRKPFRLDALQKAVSDALKDEA